ncbi:MAG: HDOD domain-containing protein [Proteobacteria bacterium]|nr:HDOD domain-containing protein [Pseudomonadota bacterium]MBU1709244.1 HDOD domain-containing protein [Pseudomonadota bacterium]
MPRKIYTFFVVDTDPVALEQFRQLFEQLSHFVYCCASIKEAKKIMGGVAPDFVIVNLKIEGESATDFLYHVKEKFPYTIRFVYANDDNTNELMKLVASGFAHRYLCFPWEKNGIAEILKRDLQTRSRLQRNKCWKFLEAGGNLPVLPAVVTDIEALLRDPDFTTEDLAAAIEKDPVISSKLLQVVNSAAFAKKSSIGDLQHAITFLGITQIKEIVLYIAVLKSFKLSEQCQVYVEDIGEHSFLCSKLAAGIAREIAPELVKDVATAALLHDIGKLIFFATACGMYKDFIDGRETFDFPSSDFESELFGISHAELGSSIMLWWNLPMAIVETAANHNLPIKELSGVPLIVSIADRCLLEATPWLKIETDITLLADDFPVDKWRQAAQDMIEGIEVENF